MSLLIVGISISLSYKAQIANYIANGSFEELYNCNFPYALRQAKSWLGIDTSEGGGGIYSICNNKVPKAGTRYQFPKTGDNYIIAGFYNPNPNGGGIGYLKNRLRSTLKSGQLYCVKFHVNICNNSPRGIDGFGIYFGDNALDTITKRTIPLTYLIPQVKNPLGNVITDTLNWVPITGTFVANGTEKFALIGNFLSNNAITTASIDTPFYPAYWTDVLIDDVSCIPLNLPAFAGNDTICVPGASVYIGRPRDVGIDEACTWFQLPNTNSVIATAAGLWVSPVTTSTYVVRQEICGNVKWDTVVVKEEPLGMEESLKFKSSMFNVWPVPAKDGLTIELLDNVKFNRYAIYDHLGQLVRTEDIVFTNQKALIQTKGLAEGVYVLQLKNDNTVTVMRKFVVGGS